MTPGIEEAPYSQQVKAYNNYVQSSHVTEFARSFKLLQFTPTHKSWQTIRYIICSPRLERVIGT